MAICTLNWLSDCAATIRARLASESSGADGDGGAGEQRCEKSAHSTEAPRIQLTSTHRVAVFSAAPRPLELLELYCGNGNHTVAMAGAFDRVLGVEINPKLVEAANVNLGTERSPLILFIAQASLSQCFGPPRRPNYRR
jgi:hypothetical protein